MHIAGGDVCCTDFKLQRQIANKHANNNSLRGKLAIVWNNTVVY